MKKNKFTPIMILPLMLELIALAVVSCGIGIELSEHAHYGLVMITSGSVTGMIGGIVWGKFMRR
jgi:hypothetical protein